MDKKKSDMLVGALTASFIIGILALGFTNASEQSTVTVTTTTLGSSTAPESTFVEPAHTTTTEATTTTTTTPTIATTATTIATTVPPSPTTTRRPATTAKPHYDPPTTATVYVAPSASSRVLSSYWSVTLAAGSEAVAFNVRNSSTGLSQTYNLEAGSTREIAGGPAGPGAILTVVANGKTVLSESVPPATTSTTAEEDPIPTEQTPAD